MFASPYFDSQSSTHPTSSSTSQSHHTSVIVPTDSSASTPETPTTPYYSNVSTPSQYPYQFPFIIPSEWPFQFPTAETTTPLGPNLNQSIGTPQFAANLGGGFYNPTANRSPLSDFYQTSSPMVQYSSTSKKTAGRKPKEQSVEMDDDDDDKKQKRRLRNKEAAARCRQRRLDLMGDLQGQVSDLKKANDRRQHEVMEARRQIEMLQEYIQQHDCKMSDEARRRFGHMPIQVPPHQPIMVMPPRAESVAHSVMSNHSSSSSEQHSPVEEYKPSIDQLKASLPSISKLMPPPALPPGPVNIPSSSIPSQIPPRSDNGFLEPELKIPKIEGDRTLSSLAGSSFDDIERPTLLGGINSGSQPINSVITTPSRPFREGSQQQTELFPRHALDFLSSNTGLTPSAQPTMAFVSTPTPIQHHSESDLRTL